MTYTRAIGNEFWYDFDNQTLWQRTPEMNAALAAAYFAHGFTFDSVMDLLRESFSRPDHAVHFVESLQLAADGFTALGDIQLSIIDGHLDDVDAIQSAYEDFGQGTLFDDRPPRPPGRLIHMMDGSPTDWVGYHRWHGFSRAAQLVGANGSRWEHINRCIGLAWAIQTETDPPVDNPDNPGMSEERLETLRAVWMAMEPERLDWAFSTHSFPAPTPEEIASAFDSGTINFTTIQQLLENGTGPAARPRHGRLGRFWLLPYSEFMTTTVYGVQLIADAGPDRGTRSALVQILRGKLPGFPQMPLNRLPMPDTDIQSIEDWIDANCPET